MVGGLITPSTILSNLTPNYDTRRYLINASLIVCGARNPSATLSPLQERVGPLRYRTRH